MLTSNAFKFCTLNSVVQNQFLVVQGSVPGPWGQWALLDKLVMSLVAKRLVTRLI
jgi:ribosomal protein L3